MAAPVVGNDAIAALEEEQSRSTAAITWIITPTTWQR